MTSFSGRKKGRVPNEEPDLNSYIDKIVLADNKRHQRIIRFSE